MDNQNPYGGGGNPGFPGGGGYGGGPGGYAGGPPVGLTTGTLEVGDVLSTTFRTIGAAFVPIAGCAIAVVLPMAVVNFAIQVVMHFALQQLQSASPDEMIAGAMLTLPITALTLLVTITAQAVGQGGIVYSVAEQMSGRAPNLGQALRVALSRAIWVVLTSLLTTLAVTVGMFMCLVPGVILAIFFSVSAPVCVVERLGPIDSISRSIQLTEGQRLTIFLIFLVTVIGYFVAAVCILMPVQMILIGGAAASGGVAALQDPLSVGQILMQIVNIPVTLAATMLFSTLVAVIYARLRGLRDGVDAQALASVFA